MKILLVEDDPSIGELLSTLLVDHRYTVDLATDGSTGLEMALLWNYDLFVLDVQMPNLDGISLCRQLRLTGSTAPILLLTVQNSTANIINGLDAGADDYVTKPFDPPQLLARIRALLRRSSQTISSSILEWEELQLNPALMQVTYHQQEVSLSVKEYGLLELLLRNPQRIFSRSAILDHLWTMDDFPSEGAVTNLVKDLRRKLKAAGLTAEFVETLYGLGYRLKADPKTEEPSPSETYSQKPAGQQRLESAGRLIAQRFKDSLSQRIGILSETMQALQTGQLSWQQQQQAREEAHRLAGGLGTFGYEQGSVLAEQIEAGLSQQPPFTAQQVTALTQLLTELTQELSEPLRQQRRSEANQRSVQQPDPQTAAACSQSVLWMIDPDPDVAQTLQTEVQGWPWTLHSISNGSVLHAENFQTAPDAILFCLDSLATGENEFIQARTLKTRFPQVPLLTYASQDNLELRMTAVRLGSCCHFARPVHPAQVLEAASALRRPSPTVPSKIMIVDDPATLASLSHLLKPWGFEVTGLSNPRQFWNRFLETQPDLLLLALELPEISGIELCQVVRRDIRSRHLPILILTTQTDSALVNQILAAGADDCISKSALDAELLTRMISRLERVQSQQRSGQPVRTRSYSAALQLDPVTQLVHSSAFQQWLTQNWRRFCQQQTPLALLLIQIDNFHDYQTQQGHLAGERCLRQMGQTIQGNLQPRDIAARYGTAEFAVLLPETDSGGALQVAKRLQQAVDDLALLYQDETIRKNVTISLGVTGTIPAEDLSVEQLITTATQALEAARQRGSHTYCVYSL